MGRSKRDYDPVAEQVLINMLQETQAHREQRERVGSSEQLQEMPKVPIWGRFEAAVAGAREYVNPITDVELRAIFRRPDKSRVSFWGFYDGDGNGGQTGNVWKLRFMPDQVGTWSYECSFSDDTPGKLTADQVRNPVLFASKNFSEWQATGQDKDSLIADPLFVDPVHGDFTLRPGSPAAQIGFEPWDVSAVGPRPVTATPVSAAPAARVLTSP